MLAYSDPEPSLTPPYSPYEAQLDREWEFLNRQKRPLETKLKRLENELEDVTMCLEELKLLDKGLQARCLELIREDYGIRIDHTKQALAELEGWR